MKIAIISDVHDHRDNLHRCLEDIKNKWVDHIIHLWDYWAPWASVKPVLVLWIPVDGIFGNNDGEKRWIIKQFSVSEMHTIHRTVFGFVELDWKKIFMSHFHDLAVPMAKSWDYDIVLYGHTHIRDFRKIWKTIICNPWGVCWNFELASYALYDSVDNTIAFIEKT